MPPIPSTNVVICTHGPRPLLTRTLESLSAAERPVGFGRFLVVENGSDAGAQQVCRQMQGKMPLEYHHLDQLGASAARQFGADQARAGLVVFFDDDLRVDPGVLTAYAQAAQQSGSKAFFGGPLLIDYEKRPPEWLLRHVGPSVAGWEPKDAQHPLQDDLWFFGANFAVWAEDLRAIGGFNAGLGPTPWAPQLMMEEVELQQRLLAGGYRPIYVPGARVWHYVSAKGCTPQWALQRHYRIWLSQAYRNGRDDPGPRIRGAPRWMWRRLLALHWQALKAVFIADPERRFQARAVYHQWRGTLEGLRLRAKQEER